MGEFDFEGTFGDDYIYFDVPGLTQERTDREADLIVRLAEPAKQSRILDVACGHGRISNTMASRGFSVTGLDRSTTFIEMAREDALRRKLDVEYVCADMRTLDTMNAFDLVINWFTAFGYFEDDENRDVLVRIRRALRPGGTLLMELQNRDAILGGFVPWIVAERDGNYRIASSAYDPLTGRIESDRISIRAGVVSKSHHFVRMFGFPELRDWLKTAGFSTVDGFGEDGERLTMKHRRMIVRARA